MKEQIEKIGDREKRVVLELSNDLNRILHQYVDMSPRQYASKEFSERYRDMGIDIDLVGITTDLLNAGYRKQAWISVEERLPENIGSYLVVVKLKYPWEKEWKYDVDAAVYNPLENGYIDHWNTWNDWNEGQECHITHWMPLPEAPKMKVGAE